MLRSFRYLSLVAALGLDAVCAQAAPSPPVEIHWTQYGIPHIRATDERGLGYGIGYAYARDNACLLLEEAMTARGERARYLGEQGVNSAGLPNLASDVLFGWVNDAAAVRRFDRAQPASMTDRLDGYVAGFNRYLQAPATPLGCANEPWAKPQTSVRRLRDWSITSGSNKSRRNGSPHCSAAEPGTLASAATWITASSMFTP